MRVLFLDFCLDFFFCAVCCLCVERAHTHTHAHTARGEYVSEERGERRARRAESVCRRSPLVGVEGGACAKKCIQLAALALCTSATLVAHVAKEVERDCTIRYTEEKEEKEEREGRLFYAFFRSLCGKTHVALIRLFRLFYAAFLYSLFLVLGRAYST